MYGIDNVHMQTIMYVLERKEDVFGPHNNDNVRDIITIKYFI